MAIPVVCECGKKLNAPDHLAGKLVKCPGCGDGVQIPAPATKAPVKPATSVSASARPESTESRRAASIYDVDGFTARYAPRSPGEATFELESERLLAVHLDGDVWTKKGAMVCYDGEITFVREGLFERGIGNFFKKAITTEGVRLTKASGAGTLYLADQGKKVSLLRLEDETLYVNGNDVLAFETTITSEIKMMKKIVGLLSGGLFNVKLEGDGIVAITTHYDPIVLVVDDEHPVYTDPNATVAWSGSLSPDLKTDVSLKTFFGRGSGESLQMKFEGEGFVVVQPFEEVYFQAGQ